MQQSDAALVRVTVSLPAGTHDALWARARADRRSLSGTAALLIEAGLGEGEPDGDGAGSGAAPSAAVQAATVGAADTASSPSPSPALPGRDGENRDGQVESEAVAADRESTRVSSSSRPASACSFDTPKGVVCKACGKKH